jgi:hypothetical protein
LLGNLILDDLGLFEVGPELICLQVEHFGQAPVGQLRQDDDRLPELIF